MGRAGSGVYVYSLSKLPGRRREIPRQHVYDSQPVVMSKVFRIDSNRLIPNADRFCVFSAISQEPRVFDQNLRVVGGQFDRTLVGGARLILTIVVVSVNLRSRRIRPPNRRIQLNCPTSVIEGSAKISLC